MRRTDHEAQKRRLPPFLFALACLAALAVLVYVSRAFRLDDMNLTGGQLTSFDTGWALETENGAQPLELPASLSGSDGVVRLSCRLPDPLPPGAVLCLQSYHQGLRAWVEGASVYMYGQGDEVAFGRAFGNVWNLIPLSQAQAGRELTLELTNAYTEHSVTVYPMLLGSRSTVLFDLLGQNLGVLIFCSGGILLGFIFLLATLLLKLRGLDYNRRSFFYLGLFILFASVWVFTDSKLPQFFFHNKAVFYLLSFYSFLLLPVPLLLFLQDFCPHHRRIITGLCWAFLLNFGVTVALSTANVVDILFLLASCHLLLFITTFCCAGLCLHEERKYHNRDVHLILWGIVILCIFGLCALVVFYFSDHSDNSRFFRYGMVVFIALLSASAIKRSLAILKENMAADTYHKMAYRDIMTGLANRAAFEKDLSELANSQIDPLALVVFDLNGLKHVNDTWGHRAGDVLICGAAKCLLQVFRDEGECYRIGGDEFVAVVPGQGEPEILQTLARLPSVLEAYNKGCTAPVDIAWGYSIRRGPQEDIKDFFQRADDWMYQNKRKSSHIRSAQP